MQRRISPAARARRALLVDALAALALAVLALSLAAGLGVVAFFGLPLLIVLALWLGVERLVASRRRSGLPRAGRSG